MPKQPAKPHYLRRNESVWTPPAVVYLDTETRTVTATDQDVLTLRLWCARFIDRRPTTLSRPRRLDKSGTTTRQIVEWLDDVFYGRKTVWLFAHNLSFDLATTRLPLVMADHGWEVSDAAIGGKSPWLRMVKDDRVLTMVDSGSWLPTKLDEIGKALGLVKPELPAEAAGSEAWLHRCREDVHILAEAMGQILDWWDEHGLGHFTITGPGCGWNAFRHVYTAQRVMVDPDEAGVTVDRRTVHGGRRGVWRVGDVKVGPLLELDITSAYPRTAAELPLPVKRSVRFDSLPLDDPRLTSDRWGIIAEVEVETDVPRWPIRWENATWYPTGRFRCHLAGPELAEAARLGCLRVIGPGYVHQLGRVLMPWARWVLAVQANTDGQHPPAAQIVAKHWGRAVIGKFASRGFEKVELGPSPVPGWGYEEGWDHATGGKGGMVDIAGRRWWVCSTGPADNAYPAVLAWVESHVRLRLSRVIEHLGPRTVIQCDTDGLIVSRAGLIKWARERAGAPSDELPANELIEWAIAELNSLITPLTIRIKRSYNSLNVIGPQHLELPGERRFSGLPRDAKLIDHNRYSGKAWPKLQWQLMHGDPRGYVRPVVEAVIKGPFANGWVTTQRRVIAPMARIAADGSNELVPWADMPAAARRHNLADDQHRALIPLMSKGNSRLYSPEQVELPLSS